MKIKAILLFTMFSFTGLFAQEEDIELEYKGDFTPNVNLSDKVMSSLDGFAFVFGWGINSMTHEDGQAMDHKLWGSSNWEVGFVNKRQLGKSRSRLVYGLTLSTNYFKLDDLDINNAANDNGYILTEDNSFDKVRLGVRYLQVPLGIGIRILKKAEVFIGGHAGLKVKGYTKKEFNSLNDEEVESQHRASFGLNKFNYGADLSLSIANIRLYGRFDFNPLFENGPKYNVYSFGLRYGY